MAEAASRAGEEPDDLTRALVAVGNRTRLRILHRLAQPAFVPDLAREMGLTRQAVAHHLEELMAVGLVEAERGARRGILPATRYVASACGLFAFKESVLGLAVMPSARAEPPLPTRPLGPGRVGSASRGAGLLLAHGDAPGRWFDLRAGTSWILGRDAKADVRLAYDPFVSTRHAHLRREGARWSLTDLHSTNGTLVNFEPLDAGEEREVEPGDLLTVGRSRLLLRSP